MREIGRREFLRKMAGAGVGLSAFGAFTTAGFTTTYAAGTGYRVKVTGGFARETAPGTLRIRALSLEPSFMLKADGDSKLPLRVEIVNVWGRRLELDDAGDAIENIEHQDGKIYFEIPAERIDRFSAGTKYTPLPGERLNFCAVSDTHLGDVEAEKNFAAVQKHINLRSPLFVVDAGDIVDVDEQKQWDVFDTHQKDFKVPLFSTIGNHDSYLSTKLYRENLGDLFYSFQVNGSQFLFLDNAQKYNNATLYMADGKRDAQWNWLKEQLAMPAKHRFVFFHFPVYGGRSMSDPMYMQSTPPAEREREIKEMTELFRKSGVEYICHGHLHSPERTAVDGIVHLRLGGGGGSRASHTDEKNVNFAQIFIDDQGIRDYIVHPLFEKEQVEKIEFCEAPVIVHPGIPQSLAVNGFGESKLFAVEPVYRLQNGDGIIVDGNIFVPGNAGSKVVIEAEYNGMKTEASMEIV